MVSGRREGSCGADHAELGALRIGHDGDGAFFVDMDLACICAPVLRYPGSSGMTVAPAPQSRHRYIGALRRITLPDRPPTRCSDRYLRVTSMRALGRKGLGRSLARSRDFPAAGPTSDTPCPPAVAGCRVGVELRDAPARFRNHPTRLGLAKREVAYDAHTRRQSVPATTSRQIGTRAGRGSLAGAGRHLL